jgi:tetratricopeptide (TPR) repeat protein
VSPRPVYLSHDAGRDYLTALPFGHVFDGLPPERWQEVGAGCAYYLHPEDGAIAGFHLARFSELDLDDPGVGELWTGPRFDAPLLGLTDLSAAEIALAARTHFAGRDSLNRFYFNQAVHLEGEEALRVWLACLETGDSMAHFALGYTLYELGRFRHAYRHLRHYTEIAPDQAWNWSWFAKAAAAIGELEEARRACERAIELTEAGSDETDAPELLAALAEEAG